MLLKQQSNTFYSRPHSKTKLIANLGGEYTPTYINF